LRDELNHRTLSFIAIYNSGRFRFASRRPHRFSNPADGAKTVVLWVNCVSSVT